MMDEGCKWPINHYGIPNEVTGKINSQGSIAMNGQERSDKKFMDRWAQKRKGGTLRFIVMFGMLYFGGMYFVAMMILDHIHGGISTSMIIGRVVNSLMAGFIFGSIAWWISERRYKRIMAVAQQVDSAEASTIAVPPSGPSGSPR